MDLHDIICGTIFHKPNKIPKLNSGKQYISILEHLFVKMNEEAAVFERSKLNNYNFNYQMKPSEFLRLRDGTKNVSKTSLVRSYGFWNTSLYCRIS